VIIRTSAIRSELLVMTRHSSEGAKPPCGVM